MLVFALMALALIGLSVVVVTSKSVFHSAIALTGALSVVAGLYALLGADFVAASQLLIYVGGIMIIMLFVIMLSQRPVAELERQANEQWPLALLFAAVVAGGLLLPFRAAYRDVVQTSSPLPTTALIGKLLLGEMLVPFEVVSLVLLAALIGAIYFCQEKEKS